MHNSTKIRNLHSKEYYIDYNSCEIYTSAFDIQFIINQSPEIHCKPFLLTSGIKQKLHPISVGYHPLYDRHHRCGNDVRAYNGPQQFFPAVYMLL